MIYVDPVEACVGNEVVGLATVHLGFVEVVVAGAWAMADARLPAGEPVIAWMSPHIRFRNRPSQLQCCKIVSRLDLKPW